MGQMTDMGRDWDEKTRAGAVAIRPRRAHDMNALEQLARTLKDMAQAQTVGDEFDAVETSPVTGTYDWRAFLKEETQDAKRRQEARARRAAKDRKNAPAAPPSPAPSVFYA